jgi:serine phosphatase RsbU (regulator of sigma subunit)/anti-sigma regulatory factor (Ser/Thr protein kinase)
MPCGTICRGVSAVAESRWDDAPCGLMTLTADATVVDVNQTVLGWVGRQRDDVVGVLHLPDLLSVGGRIYWETHLAPLLRVDGRFDEVALELTSAYGRVPVVATAVMTGSGDFVDVALFSAWERSRYERELQAARRVAERSAAQTHALQHATAALSQAVGVEAVASALLSAAVGALGALAATLWLSDEEAGLVPSGSNGEPAHAVPAPPGGDVIGLRGAVERGGRVLVPLHGHAALQGALSVAPREDPAADPLDLEVLTAVGQQAGLALDRAQLYEQSASVAHELQRSLLDVEPPDDPRFAVATAYRPGVEMLEVGGDWFDVFLVDDGVLGLCVGDVVGRGLGAASAMGQLRSAVRAVAGPEVGPAGLLSRLDRFVAQVEAASMATLAYAELELATGNIRYACAGHPPPLLLPAHGEPRLLWDGRSTPLGAFSAPRQRAEAQIRLQEGDRLLLYTDGLVERRDRGIDVGLALLREAAAGCHDLPLDHAVERLTREMLADEPGRDDVCVLLASWRGTPFERYLPADLRTLSSVRRALGGWLANRGSDDETVRDIVLAASEAMANAAEHGAGSRPDEEVHVRAGVARRDDGSREVVVTVRDRGRWRAPVRSIERGRGLRIIEALVDDVLVKDEEGTTIVLRRALRREMS